MNKVLVIAPHPDDETLGCGGTILRHLDHGDQVSWLIMTRITEQMGFEPARVKEREQEIKNVAEAYPFTSFHRAELDSMALETYPKRQVVEAISTVLKEVSPDILYIPYRLDAHSDHEVVFDAAISCSKWFRYPSVKSIRVYETLSETNFGLRPEDTGFRPNLFVDVSPFIEHKINIMKLYKGEMGSHPFPRSEKALRSLATLRGSACGKDAAEAFMLLKEII